MFLTAKPSASLKMRSPILYFNMIQLKASNKIPVSVQREAWFSEAQDGRVRELAREKAAA